MENSSISLYKMIKNTLGEKTEKHHVNPLMWKPWGKSYITARWFKPNSKIQNTYYTEWDCYTCYAKPGVCTHAKYKVEFSLLFNFQCVTLLTFSPSPLKT